MRASLSLLALFPLGAGCGTESADARDSSARLTPVPLEYARTFTLFRGDGYHVAEFEASITSWGGSAKGPVQRARIVIVPRDPGSRLPLELRGGVVVQTPVRRVAVNMAYLEAMLLALGVDDRLVAVGGAKSYDDGIRSRTLAGQIAQIGYGWHMPPNLDALVAARPDVFLMSLGDLSFVSAKRRIEQLRIPVVPMFVDAEHDYRGKVEYVRLLGLLVGREKEADAFVRRVLASVDSLKTVAARQNPRSVVSAWWFGGDTWMATVRNADAALLRDANGINLLGEPDDDRFDSFARIGTERLVQRGRDADCWILRDTHSRPFRDRGTLRQVRAYREGCLFASDGMSKPQVDAYDFYESGIIRPDIVLSDLVRMLHPSLRDQRPYVYVRPDTAVAR